MEIKSPENIYWLFSSSAQAIAAFIGFLAAGFFFIYDRLDKQIDKDETLEEIYHKIKNQYYNRLRVLFILTGSSIILSLLVVLLNGFDITTLKIILIWFVGLVNISTIIWAIVFVIYIINPNRVKIVTEQLVEENKESFEPKESNSISRGHFIDRFIELENIIRNLAEEKNVNFIKNRPYPTHPPLTSLIKGLYRQLIISESQLGQLLDIIKIRNLAVHGNMPSIESKLGVLIDNLIKDLKKIK